MFRKGLFAISMAVILSLVFGGLAFAVDEPEWVQTFDPVEYGYQPINWDDLSGSGEILALEVFKNKLYLCVASLDGAQLFRTADGITWEPVGAVGLGYNTVGCNDLAVFKNKLYASTIDAGIGFSPAPGLILRSSDGVNFETVSNSWEGSPVGVANIFGVFKGRLYVTSWNENGLAELWRSKTGDSGSWESAGNIGEWDFSMGGLQTFNGMLYISGQRWDPAGINVLRSKDGKKWETVVNDGFASFLQDGTHNRDGAFAVHQGKLFMGTANFKPIDLTDPENEIWEATGQVLSTPDGKNWTIEAAGGFGDINNVNIYTLTSYLGDLYATAINSETGAEVWKSHTGAAGTWTQVNVDGFGNKYRNLYATSQAVYKDELYTANYGGWEEGLLGMVWKLLHP